MPVVGGDEDVIAAKEVGRPQDGPKVHWVLDPAEHEPDLLLISRTLSAHLFDGFERDWLAVEPGGFSHDALVGPGSGHQSIHLSLGQVFHWDGLGPAHLQDALHPLVMLDQVVPVVNFVDGPSLGFQGALDGMDPVEEIHVLSLIISSSCPRSSIIPFQLEQIDPFSLTH